MPKNIHLVLQGWGELLLAWGGYQTRPAQANWDSSARKTLGEYGKEVGCAMHLQRLLNELRVYSVFEKIIIWGYQAPFLMPQNNWVQKVVL